jgi:hypothetical protein
MLPGAEGEGEGVLLAALKKAWRWMVSSWGKPVMRLVRVVIAPVDGHASRLCSWSAVVAQGQAVLRRGGWKDSLGAIFTSIDSCEVVRLSSCKFEVVAAGLDIFAHTPTAASTAQCQ